jgi:hypothetical protein
METRRRPLPSHVQAVDGPGVTSPVADEPE